ncbi:glycine N-acyltransferase-like protein Keg1 [Ptychodera flava]|uniref:glycine N-acyltransferase-like protein Keg1 n=1 Tax=Ptychodera flava TaxID=63121 RepID=UPI00396A80F1
MAYSVSSSEVQPLWEVLGKWTPASLPVYHLIKNSFKSENQWPSIQIYTDSNNLETLTSVVCCCENLDPAEYGKCYYLFSRDNEKLRTVLRQPGVIDWNSDNILFSLLPISALPVLVDVGREHGLQASVEEMYHTYTLANYIDTVYKVSSCEIPPDFTMAPLKNEHSSTLQSACQYAASSVADCPSVERFQKLIQYMPTLAIYDDKGSPVSWALIKECGDLSMAYTTVEYQHHGFTSIVSANLLKHMLDKGESAFIVIGDNDTASILLHTKLGFRRHEDVVTAWFTLSK